MEKLISCGNGILSRRGTEFYLSCRESFNHHHRAGTLGASPEIAGILARDRLGDMWCGVETFCASRSCQPDRNYAVRLAEFSGEPIVKIIVYGTRLAGANGPRALAGW
jgi:hypothetical protein